MAGGRAGGRGIGRRERLCLAVGRRGSVQELGAVLRCVVQRLELGCTVLCPSSQSQRRPRRQAHTLLLGRVGLLLAPCTSRLRIRPQLRLFNHTISILPLALPSKALPSKPGPSSWELLACLVMADPGMRSPPTWLSLPAPDHRATVKRVLRCSTACVKSRQPDRR